MDRLPLEYGSNGIVWTLEAPASFVEASFEDGIDEAASQVDAAAAKSLR